MRCANMGRGRDLQPVDATSTPSLPPTIQHVLVVDDSHTERLHITGLLEQQGLMVRTACSGAEALERLAEGKPDLILMDVVMPGTNGFQLTRQLARDAQFADIPIILCTSKSLPTDKVWGLRQGARDYITKPVDGAQLRAKIAALAS